MSAIPVSSVPAAVAYLASAIEEQAAADALPIQIIVGDSGMTPPNDAIQIGEIHREVEPLAMVGGGGTNWLYEKYSVAILASSWTGSGADDGGNAQQLALTARAWELVAYIETAVRLDPSLGGLDLSAFPTVSSSPGPEWTINQEGETTGMKCEVEALVHVETSI